MIDKKEALKFWESEFGTKEYGYDFSGKKIKKDDYLLENQVGWIVGYIKPLEIGGEDNAGNLIIMHHRTLNEKGLSYPKFSINDVEYTAKYNEKSDYHYIEKDNADTGGGFI